ncbi:MAG: hypothetical protein A3K59_08960 [Euryarchaeota archaeon RBG_19FT_COMBO_69_17]|nr:MAG: hypothetical protein A3K59_08960 [Euryarchaeota archaeon RBG_19FT_COMBO_69_17]
MPEDVRAALQGVIADLKRIPDVLAVSIVRRDGLPIVHSLPKAMNPKKIAAMAAAIVGTSEMAAVEMGQGDFIQSIVDSHGGKLLATGAGEEALLVTMVKEDANMGLVLLSVDRAVQTIAQLLDGDELLQTEAQT